MCSPFKSLLGTLRIILECRNHNSVNFKFNATIQKLKEEGELQKLSNQQPVVYRL